MNKTLAAAALLASLAGCATQQMTPEQAAAVQPITCSSKAQCDLYWQRAQLWVAQNSTWRIQTANDVLIQTYGPGGDSPDTAYTILRAPNPDGSATISMHDSCDNVFGCTPNVYSAMAAFKRFVVQ